MEGLLTFYLIDRTVETPDGPQHRSLETVGGFHPMAMEDLKVKGLVDSSFDLDSTFRWDEAFVQDLFEKTKSDESPFIKMMHMICMRAIETGKDLVVFR